MAKLGLLLVASLFGVLVVQTVRFPAITAALGLEWVAAWGYLIYWLSDIPDQWVRVQAVWRIGFYIPVGGQGYLWVMVPAGVLAIVAAAAQPRSRRALATTRF